MRRRRLLVTAAGGALLLCLVAALAGATFAAERSTSTTAATATSAAGPSKLCTRYASRRGSDSAPGTWRRPFKTAYRLARALRPGQTGCLRAGTYDETDDGRVVEFERSGRRGAPITIRSAPRERAKLHGVVYVAPGANWVAIRNLDLDVSNEDKDSGLAVYAENTVIEGNRITNRHDGGQCIMLGNNNTGGPAVGTRIRFNRIAECGDPDEGNLEHAIYFNNASGTVVTDNVFDGVSAYAIHLYPNARNALVSHNVINDTGSGGVIFAGEGELVSNGNVVSYNVIANTRGRNIASNWDDGNLGSGNVARSNCLWAPEGRNIDGEEGFTAVGNVVAPPNFVDAEAGDFRLQPGSACLKVVGYDAAARVVRRGE
jgi:hypothetical protein